MVALLMRLRAASVASMIALIHSAMSASEVACSRYTRLTLIIVKQCGRDASAPAVKGKRTRGGRGKLS